MATPHIAGAMALLWCARPDLRHDIAGGRTVLDNAAHFISSKLCGTRASKQCLWLGSGGYLGRGPRARPPTAAFSVVQLTTLENFDGVTPPALPPDWIATNAQGPPPLWVISDSGVPMPPADTPPNAAFIDDPDAVSDKRLDSFQFSFFEGAPYV